MPPSSRPSFVCVSLLIAALLLVPMAAAQIPGGQQVESVLTPDGPVAAENLASGLAHPWGMTFLPDGRLLVTERNSGELHILGLDGTLSAPVAGTPAVFAEGQGGLLDVALDPDFDTNGFVYLSYAAAGPGAGAASAVGRGRWEDDRIVAFERLFLQEPWIDGPNHFGGRIVFGPDGHLFLTMGERFQFEPAQNLSNHLGTIIRINRDGTIPDDNPFVGDADAQPEIWSYGHRNIQAAVTHPTTGALWVAEMGPLGGDELNQPEAGRNYGWPTVSWGMHYDGRPIPDPPTRPEFADAVMHWTPVISPSGMIVYDGAAFPGWKGDVFIGSLSSHDLVQLTIDGGAVVNEARIPLGARIRDVEQGPDGMIYLLTDQDDGNVWRLRPLVP